MSPDRRLGQGESGVASPRSRGGGAHFLYLGEEIVRRGWCGTGIIVSKTLSVSLVRLAIKGWHRRGLPGGDQSMISSCDRISLAPGQRDLEMWARWKMYGT